MLAIPLLIVYLFNVAGYQLLFSLAIQHSDNLLVQRLDEKQYKDDELLQIKIPLNLPYYNTQTAYERVNGEVSYKGVYYAYVKRKVSKDTLYILCLRNEAKTSLQDARNDYAKKAADLPTEKHSPFAKKPSSLSEHHSQPGRDSWIAATQASNPFIRPFASSLCSSILEGDLQPPEAA